LSGQPEDYETSCREIISILDEPPPSQFSKPSISQIGLITWAYRVADDPVLLSSIRPSIKSDYLHSQLLVLEYLQFALSECEQTVEAGKTVGESEQHLKKAYAFLAAALGTTNPTSLAVGLKAAEAMLPHEILFLKPGDSIQEAVDRLADGGAIFLEPGEYQDQCVVVVGPIWISRSPNASSRVRIGGGHAGEPVFLARGEAADIEFSGLTITDGSSAIRLEANASCWVSDCTLIENDFAGAEATGTSAMIITDSLVRGNYMYGVIATGAARVSLAYCDISLNVFANMQSIGAGIAASDHTTLNAQDCSVIGNSGYGIILSGSAAFSATMLSITYNQHSGLHLQQASQAYLVECRIAINGYWDISTYNPDCYAEHNDDWQPAKVFTGSLEGIDNTSQVYSDGFRTCLGDYALPEGFFPPPRGK
jgi:hypothetical protein